MISDYLNNFLQEDSIVEAIADKDWSYVFGECQLGQRSDLTRLLVKADLTSIEELLANTSTTYASMFKGFKFKSFYLPDTIKDIADGTFYNCKLLEHIVLPPNLKRIGSRAFTDCRRLQNITFPDSLETIGDIAFSGCESLTSIIFPDKLKEIGGIAFGACHNLNNVKISRSVEIIRKSAFFDCTNLTSITIPDTVKSIGEYAFLACDNLKTIIFEGTQDQWNSIVGKVEKEVKPPHTSVIFKN